MLTGSFEPPVEGAGAIQLLAFDARDGRTRAHVDAPVDAADAGAVLVATLERFGASLGVEIGALAGLRESSAGTRWRASSARSAALCTIRRAVARTTAWRPCSTWVAPSARRLARGTRPSALPRSRSMPPPVPCSTPASPQPPCAPSSAAPLDAARAPWSSSETLVALHLRLGRARTPSFA